MIRVFLVYVVLFLLPLVIYALWTRKTKKRDIPYISLFCAGLFLLGVVVGGLALWDKTSPEAKYIAPHMVDGKIVPAGWDSSK